MLFFFLFLFLTLGSAAGTVPFVPLSTFEDFTYFDFSNVSPGNVPEDALKTIYCLVIVVGIYPSVATLCRKVNNKLNGVSSFAQRCEKRFKELVTFTPLTHFAAMHHLESITPPEVWSRIKKFFQEDHKSLAARTHNNTALLQPMFEMISDLRDHLVGGKPAPKQIPMAFGKRVENKPPTSRNVQTVRKYTLGTPAIPKKNSAPAAPPAPCEPPMSLSIADATVWVTTNVLLVNEGVNGGSVLANGIFIPSMIDKGVTLVDSAGGPLLSNKPEDAGGLSRDLYRSYNIDIFPVPLLAQLQSIGDAVFWNYEPVKIIHVLSPDLRGVDTSNEDYAVSLLARCYYNVLTQFVEGAVPESMTLRVAALSSGIFLGDFSKEQMAQFTMKALILAIRRMQSNAVKLLEMAVIYLCVFFESEMSFFVDAGFNVKSRPLLQSTEPVQFNSPGALISNLYSASDDGDPKSSICLSKWLVKMGKPEDARDAALKAASQGNAEGMHQLGVVHETMGEYTDAFQCYKNAMAAGWLPSAMFVAQSLQFGRGVDVNADEAAIIYERGVVRGDPEHEYALAIYLLKIHGKCLRVTELLNSASLKGHADAIAMRSRIGARRTSRIPTPRQTATAAVSTQAAKNECVVGTQGNSSAFTDVLDPKTPSASAKTIDTSPIRGRFSVRFAVDEPEPQSSDTSKFLGDFSPASFELNGQEESKTVLKSDLKFNKDMEDWSVIDKSDRRTELTMETPAAFRRGREAAAISSPGSFTANQFPEVPQDSPAAPDMALEAWSSHFIRGTKNSPCDLLSSMDDSSSNPGSGSGKKQAGNAGSAQPPDDEDVFGLYNAAAVKTPAKNTKQMQALDPFQTLVKKQVRKMQLRSPLESLPVSMGNTPPRSHK